MPSILIKNVPQELLAEVNYRAAKRGLNQPEFLIEILREAFNGTRKISAAIPKKEVEEVAREAKVVEEAKPEEEMKTSRATKKGKECPDCGIPMKDWGRVWKCNTCRREIGK